MMWLTWRQFRVQAVTAAAALGVAAVFFAVTAPHLVHLIGHATARRRHR